MAKCLLAVTGNQAMTACNNLNLCAGLPAGIEGAIHAMGDSWTAAERLGGHTPTNPSTMVAALAAATPQERLQQSVPYATLLVDACNGFNKLSCKAALWTICHRWPNGSRFAFYCYGHAACS